MAIDLKNKPNTVNPPVAPFTNGDIKDKTSSEAGTPVNRTVYSDIHQFFAKLMEVAQIPYNNQLDNAESNQLFDALMKVFQGEDWDKLSLFDSASNYLYFRKDKLGFVYIVGVLQVSGLARTLPVGYRPSSQIKFDGVGQRNNSSFELYAPVYVETSGLIHCPQFGTGITDIASVQVNFSFKGE